MCAIFSSTLAIDQAGSVWGPTSVLSMPCEGVICLWYGANGMQYLNIED